MGSGCAKLSTGHGRGHESSMKKLVACVSQDNFSLSSEDEEEEEGEEEQEEQEEEQEEEEIPVQGKLQLMEAKQQEVDTVDEPEVQQSEAVSEPQPAHS